MFCHRAAVLLAKWFHELLLHRDKVAGMLWFVLRQCESGQNQLNDRFVPVRMTAFLRTGRQLGSMMVLAVVGRR